ncbi:MAG: ferredoxin--NADP reductase [Limnobacter sp.]|nr:ferredoxin--NADP reductase [Limnobacter sp.]
MPEANHKYTLETITGIHTWVPGKLFSFTCTRPPGFRFAAGQFARLGMENTLQLQGEGPVIWRAYSMVSGPYDEQLEFFSIVVPNGAFTSHLSQLQVGGTLCIDKTSFGFLTTARFESGSQLWMLSSGTGLAPFLSILNDPAPWQQFQHIVLVHSARTTAELAYESVIQGLAQHPMLSELVPNLGSRFHYVPVVTREASPSGLIQRIPELLQSGALQQYTGLHTSVQASRFMICGNPDMVKDVRTTLKSMGYTNARQSAPGQIAVENYW